MKVKPFFVVFPVLVGVVVYAYYAPKQKPEGAVDLTPKEYIELVEKTRAEKLKQEAEAKKRAAAERESETPPADPGQ